MKTLFLFDRRHATRATGRLGPRWLLVSALLWCGTSSAAGQPNAGAAQARYDCLMEPMVVVELGSASQGVIQSLSVGRSDLVLRGQVVAELDASVERASQRQAQTRADMHAQISAREVELALATKRMARVNELFYQRMMSSQDRDEAHATLQLAQASLRQAQESQQLAERELHWANSIVERRTIRSPIDGVVVEQKSFPGEFVYENAIMTIAQIDPLRIEVILPAELYGRLQVGMQAHVLPEVTGPIEVPATVTAVDRVIDAGSSTFGVQLQLPNPGGRIPSGQRCEIGFFDQTALTTPAPADPASDQAGQAPAPLVAGLLRPE